MQLFKLWNQLVVKCTQYKHSNALFENKKKKKRGILKHISSCILVFSLKELCIHRLTRKHWNALFNLKNNRLSIVLFCIFTKWFIHSYILYKDESIIWELFYLYKILILLGRFLTRCNYFFYTHKYTYLKKKISSKHEIRGSLSVVLFVGLQTWNVYCIIIKHVFLFWVAILLLTFVLSIYTYFIKTMEKFHAMIFP